MSKWRSNVSTQGANEDGQALVEYGLILALVALAGVVGLTLMGSDVGGLYNVVETIAKAMADALGG